MRCSGDKSACSTDGRRRRSHRSRLLRNQIRTIASEAQIVCRRLAGSQQFLPLSALYATASNLKGLPPHPPFCIPLIICLSGWVFCGQTDGRICGQALLSRRVLATQSKKR